MRYLAIDYGDKRTGLAICDPTETIASPLAVIEGQKDLLKKIAEVVKAETCGAGCAPGLKYVFGAGGVLLPEESTIPWYCLWAMAPMVPFFYICYDRLAAGLDPSDMAFEYVWCQDTGVDCGGFGKVLFKVRWEKVSR